MRTINRNGTCIGLLLVVASAILASSPAHGAYQLLYSFSSVGTSGPRQPYGSLIQSGSLLYGMTQNGGGIPGGQGSIFQYDLNSNSLTIPHTFFNGVDGGFPYGTLVQSGTNLYGMTFAGKNNSGGGLFRYNTANNTTTLLHNFTGGTTDGRDLYGSPLMVGSMLYGMSYEGGASNKGTLFQYDLSTNAYAVVSSFAGGTSDGANPYGSLISSGSVLYGMTSGGGSSNRGTIFSYDIATQSRRILHSFVGGSTDGSEPHGSLLLSGNTLYGMTYAGGASSVGTIFACDKDTGDTQLLYSFKMTNGDGYHPYDSLILSGTTLFGMTQDGGARVPPGAYGGAIISFDLSNNTEAVVHSFGPGDGNVAHASLLLSGSTMYGMTMYGGTNDGGTIFRIDVPEPAAGAVVALAFASVLRRSRRPAVSP